MFPKIRQYLFMRGLKAGACQRAEDMPIGTKSIIYERGWDFLKDFLRDI